jgi:uncharacterized RDD family membrane protein YckC
MSQDHIRLATVVQFAGFWRRAGAAFLDGVVIQFGLTILSGFLTTRMKHSGAGLLILAVLWPVATWLYFTRMESSARQATVGKMAVGLRVTDLNGERISINRANGRFLGKVAWAGLPVGALAAATFLFVFRATKGTGPSGLPAAQDAAWAAWAGFLLAELVLAVAMIVVVLIGALTISFSKRKQAPHDKWSGCVVVYP